MMNRIVSALSSIDSVTWFHVVGFISAVLLFFGFIAGIVGVGLSWKINRAQTAELARISARIEEETRKLEEAEKRVESLVKRLQPRKVPPSFLEFLRGKPTGSVEFFFQDEDSEAYMLAIDLQTKLKDAGWRVTAPEPVKASGKVPPVWPGAPLSPSGGGYAGGVMLLAKVLEPPPHRGHTPYSAIAGALFATEFGLYARMDESLPANSFRIIVGPKP